MSQQDINTHEHTGTSEYIYDYYDYSSPEYYPLDYNYSNSSFLTPQLPVESTYTYSFAVRFDNGRLEYARLDNSGQIVPDDILHETGLILERLLPSIGRPETPDYNITLEKKSATEINCGKECYICLDNIQINNEVSELSCKHTFHYECIEKWVNIQKENRVEEVVCPVCRNAL